MVYCFEWSSHCRAMVPFSCVALSLGSIVCLNVFFARLSPFLARLSELLLCPRSIQLYEELRLEASAGLVLIRASHAEHRVHLVDENHSRLGPQKKTYPVHNRKKKQVKASDEDRQRDSIIVFLKHSWDGKRLKAGLGLKTAQITCIDVNRYDLTHRTKRL